MPRKPKTSTIVQPEKAPIVGRTDTWLSAGTLKSMKAAKAHGQEAGLITIEFRSEVELPDAGDVTIKGTIFGSVEGANLVARAMHHTFVQENHGLAVMREYHAGEVQKLKGQIAGLEAQLAEAKKEADGRAG